MFTSRLCHHPRIPKLWEVAPRDLDQCDLKGPRRGSDRGTFINLVWLLGFAAIFFFPDW